MTFFAGMAEFERDLLRDRTDFGRRAAIDRGVRFGRPAKMTAEQLKLARKLLRQGKSIRQTFGTLELLDLQDAGQSHATNNLATDGLLAPQAEKLLRDMPKNVPGEIDLEIIEPLKHPREAVDEAAQNAKKIKDSWPSWDTFKQKAPQGLENVNKYLQKRSIL